MQFYADYVCGNKPSQALFTNSLKQEIDSLKDQFLQCVFPDLTPSLNTQTLKYPLTIQIIIYGRLCWEEHLQLINLH